MGRIRWLSLLVLLGLPLAHLRADGWRKDGNQLQVVNKGLHGTVVDHTANHGVDNRIWARSLWERRDLYVYLPPGFDPHQRYPVMLWMHGFYADEQEFLRLVPVIDAAIHSGKLAPLIVAAPDGSFKGEPHPHQAGSFFVNSHSGDFADFVLYDVWDFVCARYPVCADRGGHVLAGVGMGGFAAFHHGIKHRYAFGAVIGIMPPLNLRWTNKGGQYLAQFNPYDWGWRGNLAECGDVITRDCGGLKPVCLSHWLAPIYGLGTGAVAGMAQDNPIELLEATRLCPGQLEMYVGYAGKDDYNIDAQVESFLYAARWKGLEVGIGYTPTDRHNVHTAEKLLPSALTWLATRLAPYAPANGVVPAGCEGGNCPAEPRRPARRHRRAPCADGSCVDDPHYPPLTLPDYHSLKR